MRDSVTLRLTAAMPGLGLLLLGISVFAAREMQEQQARHTRVVSGEVSGLLAMSELSHVVRDIRYQINLFLRTGDRRHLQEALDLREVIVARLAFVSALMRSDPHDEPLVAVEEGYSRCRHLLEAVVTPLLETNAGTATDASGGPRIHEADTRALARLADEQLTEEVLSPLFETIAVSRGVLDRMTAASRTTTRRLTFGILVLGVCGAATGLVFGVMTARSITARFRRSDRELLRREQLAQVGQLAAGLAHELRNPLMPLKMIVQAALERRDSGISGRSLDIMHEEITRLERAVAVLLDFARPPRAEKTATDVRDLIEPAIDLVATRAARQGVTIAAALPTAPTRATVDGVMIRQVLLNLLLNSLDAQPQGGTINVTVEERTTPRVRHAGEPCVVSAPPTTGRTLVIRVGDTGPGVPADILPTVLEPFVTTKETGLGLGLSLSSRIAAAHAGRITAANLSGGGAEFALELPLTLPDASLSGSL